MSVAGAMMPPDSRSSDRKVHYTMKTPRQGTSPHSHSHSHSHSNSQSYRSNRTSTPVASPRMPFSVGQPYPPKLSPGAASRTSTQVQNVRSPSPNYFGLIVEPATDPRDSTVLPRSNWSPPTSSVNSFAAAIPQHMPLDANPEFEAFRRQADANRGFRLNGAQIEAQVVSTPMAAPSTLSSRHKASRWQPHGNDSPSELLAPRSVGVAAAVSRLRDSRDVAPKMDVDADSNSLHDSAYVSAESKRNSESSLNPPSFLNGPRHESPAPFEPSASESRKSVSQVEDRHPRLSVSGGRADGSESGRSHARADTEPARLEPGAPKMMSPTELRDILEGPAVDGLLLLDVRVATHYAASRIRGALNLCIPTTLLKRATFNLHKLQQTFQSDEQQSVFAAWRAKTYLVVYDASSTDKRDAVAARNMLLKFTNEGYAGKACVLRGGFNAFATAYPHLVDSRVPTEPSQSATLSLSQGQRRPTLPPVLGGVALPVASNEPVPFFSNIRQNVDLADGVGQMDVAVPPNVDVFALPEWLRAAADSKDRGKMVSDKFLNIEQAEQTRMKNAYSVFNASSQNKEQVQLSGIEKGVKNRYKDILPFEHARVRLEGRVEGDCDYINASHIKATRSHKRYIASQGPLPATFDDFWSVVWDQDVRVLVMLTAESEGGQLKCHPYWTGKEHGAIRLRALSEKKVSLDIDKHRSHSTISAMSPSSNTPTSTGTSSTETGRRRANTTTTFEGATPTPAQPGTAGGSSLSETPFVIIRKFALSHTAHPFAPIREITHLHYPSWPDFGAPAQPAHLLALVELANVMQRAALPAEGPYPRPLAASEGPQPLARSTSSLVRQAVSSPSMAWYDEPEQDAHARPMLVHCSAGCGRTGTFCAVDSVIDMLKRKRVHDVGKANRTAAAAAAARRHVEVDNDGDVSMSEDDESVSPLTRGAPVTPFGVRMEVDTPPVYGVANNDGGAAEGGLDTAFLDDGGVDLVARTVEDFRGQRISMVQSLRQFVLCYETVLEYLWRMQERSGGGAGDGGGAAEGSGAAVSGGRRTRARSGSLQVGRTNS